MKKFILVLFTLLLIYNHQTVQAQKTDMEVSGDILQFAIPLGALASTYYYQGNDKPHWQMLKAYGASLIFTHSVKHIINKRRPNGGNYSFPSGHTTAAFSGAAFLHLRYGWKIGIPAYLLASYVGYTRIVAHKHDKWDVLGGAIVGIGGALLFVKPYQSQTGSPTTLQSVEYSITSLNNPMMFAPNNKNYAFLLNKVEGYYIIGFHYQF
jgi:hypothetical protein